MGLKMIFSKFSSLVICIGVFTLLGGGVGCQSKPPTQNPAKPEVSSPSPLGKDRLVIPPVKSFELFKTTYLPGEVNQFCGQVLQDFEASLAKIVSRPLQERNFSNTFAEFDEALWWASSQVYPLIFLRDMAAKEVPMDEVNDCELRHSRFVNSLALRDDLYEALKSAPPPTGKVEKRLVERTLIYFEKLGVNLEPSIRKRSQELLTRFDKVKVDFSNNIRLSRKVLVFKNEELQGASADFLSRLETTPDGRRKVVLNEPHFQYLMENLDLAESRKAVLFSYLTQAKDENLKLIVEAASIFKEVAEQRRYGNWVDLAISDRMAKDSKTVAKFLKDLEAPLMAAAKKDLSLLQRALDKDLQSQNSPTRPLEFYDIPYYRNRLIETQFGLDQEELRKYFPFVHVRKQVFDFYESMFSIQFIPIAVSNSWNENVQLYQLKDKLKGEHLGYFYVDAVARDKKRSGAAAYPLVTVRRKGEQWIRPVVGLVANAKPAGTGQDVVLSFHELRSFFHEMGHVLHMLLNQVPYGTLSGFSVAWDFVEAPSQMLENFLYEKANIKRMSKHIQTGQEIPDDLVTKLIQANEFQKALGFLRQLSFAQFDQAVFTQQHSGPEDILNLYNKITFDLYGMYPLEGTSFPSIFSHLVSGGLFEGYSGGYYSYLWSLVYAQDIYSKFSEAKFPKLIGRKYRRKILEKGNSEEPSVMLRSFLGREPNAKAFLNYLLKSEGKSP